MPPNAKQFLVIIAGAVAFGGGQFGCAHRSLWSDANEHMANFAAPATNLVDGTLPFGEVGEAAGGSVRFRDEWSGVIVLSSGRAPNVCENRTATSPNGNGHMVQIWFFYGRERLGPAKVQVSGNGAGHSDEKVRAGLEYFDVGPSGEIIGHYVATDGEINIEAIDNTRIVGTFSVGLLENLAQPGHLYRLNVDNGTKEQLSGSFVVAGPCNDSRWEMSTDSLP